MASLYVIIENTSTKEILRFPRFLTDTIPKGYTVKLDALDKNNELKNQYWSIKRWLS